MIDAKGTAAKLAELGSAVQREVEGTEPDPFDDAVLGAVFGLVELSKTHSREMVELEERFARLARRVQ